MSRKKNSIQFQYNNPYFVIFMTKFHLKNIDVNTFLEEGAKKVYVLYTYVNVDNYGQPLSQIIK